MAVAAKVSAAGYLARPLLLEYWACRAGIINGRHSSFDGNVCGNCMTISTSSAFRLGVPQPQHQSDIKTSRWNRAIAEADKFLGYPKMAPSGPMLSSGDVLSMSSQLDTIIEPNHPLMKIIERLIYGHNNMQPRGLIVLLLAKVMEHLDNATKASKEEIFEKHRILATGTDIEHMGTQAHSAISNVDSVHCDNVTRDRLNYANKMSVMVGDMMMAKAILLFGSIRTSEVAGLMSASLSDFISGLFMYEQDDHGNAYPSKRTTLADWEMRSFLVNASKMANSSKSLMFLCELDKHYQDTGFEFGKQLGLAWQASADLEQFVDCDENSLPASFSLVSCPIVLHLQRDTSLLDLLAPHRKDLSKVDYKKIYEMVSDGPAIREAQEVCQNHVQRALNTLQQFPNSAARTTLENIVASLEV